MVMEFATLICFLSPSVSESEQRLCSILTIIPGLSPDGIAENNTGTLYHELFGDDHGGTLLLQHA